MKKTFIILFASIAISSYSPVFAVEVAPRISDREIIEGLADIRGDIKEINARLDAVNARLDAMNARLDAMDRKFEARFDDFRWMFSMFITIALVMLGFVLRMQWQMHKKQAQIEIRLETQKDELSFLKGLIEKLILSRGVL